MPNPREDLKLLETDNCKINHMPWYNGDYPPSYKNQPPALREKAVEIANQLLEQGAEEGIAIATGLKRARLFFKKQADEAERKKAETSGGKEMPPLRKKKDSL